MHRQLSKNLDLSSDFRGYRDLKDELGGVKKRVDLLQNNVGDLKAEWMLMKREVTTISSDTSKFTDGQADLKDATSKLTSMVQNVQKDTTSLKKQHKDLQTLNSNLRKTIVDLRNENVRLRDGQTDVRVEGLKFHKDLIEVSSFREVFSIRNVLFRKYNHLKIKYTLLTPQSYYFLFLTALANKSVPPGLECSFYATASEF